MTVLALRLAGPMQSWGASSRFTTRDTRREPTKSGVIGLLAAALGRRREADLSDLAALRFGVRLDQPGSVMRDFHTALDGNGGSLPLTQRYYLADAAFLAVVEGEAEFISRLDDAVRRPGFPLFLGRRGCPPTLPVSLGSRELSHAEVLRTEPWVAAPWYQKLVAKQTTLSEAELDVVRDAGPSELGGESVRDVPLSFDPVHRRYAWRDVVRERVAVGNPSAAPDGAPTPPSGEPDWLAPLKGL